MFTRNSDRLEPPTMDFYIPHAKDAAHASEIYQATIKHCEEQTGWRVLSKKIHALRNRHNGQEYIASVGSNDYFDGEVICILEFEVTYLVCTANRGVLSGHSILVGREEVSDIELFDDDAPQMSSS